MTAPPNPPPLPPPGYAHSHCERHDRHILHLVNAPPPVCWACWLVQVNRKEVAA